MAQSKRFYKSRCMNDNPRPLHEPDAVLYARYIVVEDFTVQTVVVLLDVRSDLARVELQCDAFGRPKMSGLCGVLLRSHVGVPGPHHASYSHALQPRAFPTCDLSRYRM